MSAEGTGRTASRMTLRKVKKMKVPKVVAVREALNKHGKDCSYAQAKDYAKKQHNLDIDDSTFYTERRLLQERLKKMPPTTEQAPQNTTPTNGQTAAPPPATVQNTPPPQDMGGIIELVKSGKMLIEKLGSKDKAKELIDTL